MVGWGSFLSTGSNPKLQKLRASISALQMGDISALQGDENRQTPERTPAQLQPQLYSGGRNSELKLSSSHTTFLLQGYVQTKLSKIKDSHSIHLW